MAVAAPAAFASDVQSASAKARPRKQRRLLIQMNAFYVRTEGVYLAEESEDTDYEPHEQYFSDNQEEYILHDEDWELFPNHKVRRKHCRSTSSNKKLKPNPHKTVKTSLHRKDVKTKENIQSNVKARKENNEKQLQKRRVQRFGYDIYHRRTNDINSGSIKPTKMVAPHSYVPHKQRWKHNKRQEDHPAALRYELKGDEVRDELSRRLADLQHRDLTPEDYDLLLRLDEKVPPKTVSKSELASLDIQTLDSVSTLIGELCSICMEVYSELQCVKTLPCHHTFHCTCIDTWLSSASLNCPLDGIAVQT